MVMERRTWQRTESQGGLPESEETPPHCLHHYMLWHGELRPGISRCALATWQAVLVPLLGPKLPAFPLLCPHIRVSGQRGQTGQ